MLALCTLSACGGRIDDPARDFEPAPTYNPEPPPAALAPDAPEIEAGPAPERVCEIASDPPEVADCTDGGYDWFASAGRVGCEFAPCQPGAKCVSRANPTIAGVCR